MSSGKCFERGGIPREQDYAKKGFWRKREGTVLSREKKWLARLLGKFAGFRKKWAFPDLFFISRSRFKSEFNVFSTLLITFLLLLVMSCQN